MYQVNLFSLITTPFWFTASQENERVKVMNVRSLYSVICDTLSYCDIVCRIATLSDAAITDRPMLPRTHPLRNIIFWRPKFTGLALPCFLYRMRLPRDIKPAKCKFRRSSICLFIARVNFRHVNVIFVQNKFQCKLHYVGMLTIFSVIPLIYHGTLRDPPHSKTGTLIHRAHYLQINLKASTNLSRLYYEM